MTAQPMDDRDLLSILKQEEVDASSYYSSELAHKQADAMDRYNAELYGDEVEGRSKFVSQDLENTVQTIMPHIMRLFMQDDELLTVDDDVNDITEIEQHVKSYLLHIFFKDNPGETICHDFVWDGLVQRIGIVRVAVEDPKPQPPKEYHGLTPDQAMRFVEDPEFEIIEQTNNEGSFDLKVKRTPKAKQFVIEAVAPEEFAITTRSKSIDEAGYHRLKQEVYIADLAREFPDSAGELDPTGAHATDDQQDDLDSDPRKQARFDSENYDTNGGQSHEQQRRTVDLLTEWIRIDFDGDGVVELRQVKRVGNTILENIIVEHSELVEWSPSRIPHKAIGRSVADQICELQKAATVVTRTYFDGLGQSLMPRTVVNQQQLADPSVLDQIIDRDIGDTIPINGDARSAIAEMPTPDVSQSALAALEHLDQQLEQASGVMRAAQGQNADAVTETADGIRRLQAAANGRIELIGRWAAKGVERIFQRLLKLVVQYQDQPRIIKINGQPMPIDPSTWSEEMTVSVHVGVAGETREEKAQKLSITIAKQEQIMIELSKLGIQPDANPVANLHQYTNALHDLQKCYGMKDADRYFTALPPQFSLGLPPPGQQQDPKALEAQARVLLEQQKAQAQAQLQAQKQQFDQQASSRELEFKEALAAREAETQEQLQSMKLESERQIAQLRITSEQEIARERMAMENQLAYDRMAMEQTLARIKHDDAQEIARSNVAMKSNGSNGISKNRPGGDLSK